MIILLQLGHNLCIAKFSVCRLQNYELLSQHYRMSKAINVKKKKKTLSEQLNHK
jgi:hypothetical protein